jgi:hypothetical protein
VDEQQPVNKGGRPSFQPNDDQRKLVSSMASVGIQHSHIAQVLEISQDTLRKYFRKELDTAMTMANAKVAANLFRQATKDDPRAIGAAIFWAKTRMGWKEPVHVEHSGSIASKFEQMSDDELRAFIERNDAGAGDIFAASQSFANTGKPN